MWLEKRINASLSLSVSVCLSVSLSLSLSLSKWPACLPVCPSLLFSPSVPNGSEPAGAAWWHHKAAAGRRCGRCAWWAWRVVGGGRWVLKNQKNYVSRPSAERDTRRRPMAPPWRGHTPPGVFRPGKAPIAPKLTALSDSAIHGATAFSHRFSQLTI